jgi:uncharacterized protein YkwD
VGRVETTGRGIAFLPDRADEVGVKRATPLRLSVVVIVAAVVATGFLAASALATSRSEKSMQTMNHQVLAAINGFRVSHGLKPLRESSSLDRSARQHSLEMGRDGYFAHASANGTAFWRRIRHYFSARNYSYWSVGENLLWAAPSVTARHALKMWVASPEHRRNLLTAQWRQIGISAVHVLQAPGIFHGLRVTIITTDFGIRR